MKKDNRGGKREGAGKPLKYGEPTKRVLFRLPESKIAEIKIKLNKILKTYLIKKS
jgi:hypothetical protein